MTRQHAFRPTKKPTIVVPIVATRPRPNPLGWVQDVSRYFRDHLDEDEQERFRLNVDGVMDAIDPEVAKRLYLSQLLVSGPHAAVAQLRSNIVRRYLENRVIQETAACIEAQASFEQMEKCRKRLERLDAGARMGPSRDALRTAIHACEGDALATTKGVIYTVWQAKSLASDLKKDRAAPYRRAAIIAASEAFVAALQRAAGFQA
jgi:hypothetical protein